MNSERLNSTQSDKLDKPSSQDSEVNKTEVLESEGFDLSAFFDIENEPSTTDANTNELINEPIPDLLVTLRNDANASIATITSKVTAETFATGASLTSSFFSALGSLVGSCGVLCAHTLGSLGQVSSGLSGASSLGGINMPRFSVDKTGNFHLDSDINFLSRMTGISTPDLLSGRVSAEEILTAFISVFSENIGLIFGFGLAEMLIGCMFDCFLPTSSANKLAGTA